MEQGNKEKEEIERHLTLLAIVYSTAVWHIKAETEEEIVRVGLDRLNEILKPEFSSVLIFEDGFLKIKASCGIKRAICEKTKIEIGTGTCGEVFITGMPIIIKDLSKDPSFIDPFIKDMDVKSIFCYPIKIDDNIAGVIWVGFLSSYIPSKEEEWLVSLVAERIARALQIHRAKKSVE